MLKVFLCASFVAVVLFAGCNKDNGNGQHQIIPVSDVSESRFVPSKTLDGFGSEDELKLYPSKVADCATYNDKGTKKLDPRLVNGYHETQIQMESGDAKYSASTTIQVTTISDRTENTYIEREQYSSPSFPGFPANFTITDKCTFSTDGGSMLECVPYDDATKALMAQASDNSGYEFKSSADNASSFTYKREFGQYTLLNKTVVPAFRRTETTLGKLTFNGQTVQATEKWVQVSTYEIPTRGAGCNTTNVYDLTYYTDDKNHHIRSHSNEISDFSK